MFLGLKNLQGFTQFFINILNFAYWLDVSKNQRRDVQMSNCTCQNTDLLLNKYTNIESVENILQDKCVRIVKDLLKVKRQPCLIWNIARVTTLLLQYLEKAFCKLLWAIVSTTIHPATVCWCFILQEGQTMVIRMREQTGGSLYFLLQCLYFYYWSPY